MVIEVNPFATVDKDSVIGALRAVGTRDPDILRARKRNLIRSVRIQKHMGILLMISAALVWLTPARALVGVPIAVLGWWLWLRGTRNVAAVEAGYTEFFKTPNP